MRSLFRAELMKCAASPRAIGSISFTLQQEVDMCDQEMDDQLVLYGRIFASRLLLGTARYESPHQLTEAISAADPAMLTVSLRRQLSTSKDSGAGGTP